MGKCSPHLHDAFLTILPDRPTSAITESEPSNVALGLQSNGYDAHTNWKAVGFGGGRFVEESQGPKQNNKKKRSFLHPSSWF